MTLERIALLLSYVKRALIMGHEFALGSDIRIIIIL